MSISSVNSTTTAQAAATASASSGTTVAATQANFLKLLVAQLNNQDPMNPMDNAQMTTQMAQLNMVSGIDKLNATVQTMADQFSSLQAMQGASLVGQTVLVNGSSLPLTAGAGNGAFTLANNADAVSVQVLNAGGQVIDTIKLGAQTAGQHPFTWNTTDYAKQTDLTFNVVATAAGQSVAATPLMQSKVVSANPTGTGLTLSLQGVTNPVPYSSVVSIL